MESPIDPYKLSWAQRLDLVTRQARHGDTLPHGYVWLGGLVVFTVGFRLVAAVARVKATSRRETFVRFNAGIMFLWWCARLSPQTFLVGAPKVSWLALLGSRRNLLDVAAHATSFGFLALVTCHHRAPKWSMSVLVACLLYLCVFDPLCVGDYFVTTLVLLLACCCLPSAQGSLAGLQLVMVLMMVGAGLSKVGPHYDRPGGGALALAVGWYAPRWVGDIFWRGHDDMTPSDFTKVLSCAWTSLEICVPLLLFSSSNARVKLAVATLVLMHAAMSFGAPVLDFLHVWCTVTWCYLFLGGDEGGPACGFDYAGAGRMPRPVKAAFGLFAALNLWAQLQPELDWHPLLKFNHFASGNQPCQNPVLVRRAAFPRLRARAPFRGAASWEHKGDQFLDIALGHRWLLELNHKASAALLDRAAQICGADQGSHAVVLAEDFVHVLAGQDSSTMNNYNLLFFQEFVKMGQGWLDPCDVVLVWMAPVSWPILPLGPQVSRWSIWDGAKGLLRSGELTAQELQSVTRPSMAASLVQDPAAGQAQEDERQEL